MALQMDPGEILREYNAAVRKDKQIQILAELNCCRPLEIALCLREQGAALTGTWKARLAAHDRAGMRMELPKDGEEAGSAVRGPHPAPSGPPAELGASHASRASGSPCEGKAESGGPSRTPAPTEGTQKAVLTAGALQELLSAVPGDTPVQICGHPGQATAALFIMRTDARGTGFVLRIQREE